LTPNFVGGRGYGAALADRGQAFLISAPKSGMVSVEDRSETRAGGVSFDALKPINIFICGCIM
jgi:hypothetical protein